MKRGPLLLVLLVLVLLGAAAWLLYGDEILEALLSSPDRAATGAEGPEAVSVDPDTRRGPTLEGAGPRVARGDPAGRAGSSASDGDEPGAAGSAETYAPFVATVLGPDGKPATGVSALVEWRTADGGGAMAALDGTDAEGRLSLDLAPGRYSLFLLGRDGGLFLPDFVVDGSNRKGSTFTLQPAATLEVEVVRAGLPLPDTQVDLFLLSGDAQTSIPARGTKRTGSDGVAVVEGVPLGPYRLRAILPDAIQVERRVDVSEDRRFRVEVPEAVELSGVVADADTGLGVAGAAFTLEFWGRESVLRVFNASRGDGSYSFPVPRSRLQRVSVVAHGYAPAPAPGEARTVFAALRPLERGIAVEHAFRLARGATLTGIATDGLGMPAAGVVLRFTPGRNAPLFAATDAEGRFELRGLNPGTLALSADTEGWYVVKPAQVEVPADRPLVETAVSLLRSRTVSGVVVRSEGGPAAAARVWLSAGQGILRSARDAGRDLETFTDAAGRWTLGDVPADRGVVARAALGELEAAPVWVPKDLKPGEGVRLVLAPTGSVHGRVTDRESGLGVAGAAVRLQPVGDPRGREARATTTDAAGAYRIEMLLPGAWDAVAQKGQEFLPMDPRRFEVTTTALDPVVDLPLDPGLTISGTVVDAANRGVAGARVRVRGNANDGRGVQRDGTCDGRGAFRITGFVAGLYRAAASREGYRNVSVDGLRGGERNLLLRLELLPPSR